MSAPHSFDVEGGDFEKYASKLVAQSQSQQALFSKENQQVKADILQGMREQSSLEQSSESIENHQERIIDHLKDEDSKIKQELATGEARPRPTFRSDAAAAPTQEALGTVEAASAPRQTREEIPLSSYVPNASPAYQDRFTAAGRRQLDANNDKVLPIAIPLIMMWGMTAMVGYFCIQDEEILPVCMFALFSVLVSALLIRSRQRAKQKQAKKL